jgi:integrase
VASVYKRTGRAGKEADKYTVAWRDADGVWKTKVAYSDKTASQALANRLETESAQVRDGTIPREELTRREASRRVLSDHINDYKLNIQAEGGTEKHAKNTASAITKLLDDASVKRITDMTPDKIQAALGRLRQVRSPRTVNHALVAVKGFANWLRDSDRIEGHKLKRLAAFNEEVDRVRERRAISPAELARLLAATEASEPLKTSPKGYQHTETFLSGFERAMIYRLATETGFRADEIRRLTRDSFDLDFPCIRLPTSKNGRRVEQRIRASFVARLREWLPTRPEKGPLIFVPRNTAKMLRRDLKIAEIPYVDAKGLYFDFHALRGQYVTALEQGGASIKTLQTLARHADPATTIKRYARSDKTDQTKALDLLPGDEAS